MLKLAEQEGRKDVVLDLSNVRFVEQEAFAGTGMDPEAMGILIALNRKIGSTQKTLRLCGLHHRIHEALALVPNGPTPSTSMKTLAKH